MQFDYLIVGAGLYGAVFAHEMKKAGKKCYVIDRRDHIAGNIYTEKKNGINVHRYGAHIFHTSDKEVWEYVQNFAEFNNYINCPVARYKDELYNLPFNMNTFSKMWNIQTPAQAMEIIEKQRRESAVENPSNLEEQALSLAGRDVYTKLIKGYTEKQWGRDCKELPSFIIKRLPFRFTFDNNYFNDPYQGIPKGGYTGIVEKLLEGIPVELGVDFKKAVKEVPAGNGEGTVFEMNGSTFGKVLYTGMIDEFFDDCFGPLEYRSFPSQGSSSTSSSSSGKIPRPASRSRARSSPESIPRHGRKAWSLTTLSTMIRITRLMRSITRWRWRRRMCCLAEDLACTNILTWTR